MVKLGRKVVQAEDKILELEAAFDRDPTGLDKRLVCQTKQELNDKLQIEKLLWRQKANIKSIKEEDYNSKFFHQCF